MSNLGWASTSDCMKCGFSLLGRGQTEQEASVEHDRKKREHNIRRHPELNDKGE